MLEGNESEDIRVAMNNLGTSLKNPGFHLLHYGVFGESMI